MIPISLTLQGFYSYKQKQTIDFTNLTKAGVFGIFGATGSGKSAIIEAIMIALYGETERLNSREDRSYNFMNLQSNELHIEFVCYSHFTQTQYLIQVQAKRSNKHFEQVSPLKRTCYKIIENEWVPIEESVIQSEVTGLSYNNFKHTVIIPQGRFMDFLQLTPTERTGMLKDIFDLHAFELQDKVKQIESDTLEQITFIQGNLQEIGEIDEQALHLLETQEQQLLNTGKEQKKQLELLQIKLQNVTQIQQQVIQLQKTTETLQSLQSKSQEFKELELLISNIDTCVQHIAPLYNSLKNKQQDIVVMQKSVESSKQQLLQQEQEFDIIQKQFESIENDYKNREEYQQHTKEMQVLLEIKKSELLLHEIDEEYQKYQTLINSNTEHLQNLQSRFEDISQARKTVIDSTQDISSLYAKKQELETYNRICNQIEECREKRIAYDNTIQEIKQSFCTIFTKISGKTINYNECKEFVSHMLHTLESNSQQIENQLQQLFLHQHIDQLRTTLVNGTPCPVCGSLEHSTDSVPTLDLQTHATLETHKEQILQEIANYNKLMQQYDKTETHILLLHKQDSEVSQLMHSLTIERNLQEPEFKERDIKQFEIQIQEIAQHQAAAKKHEEQLTQIEKERKTVSNSLQELQTNITNLQTTRIQTQTRITTLKESVSEDIFTQYESISSDIVLQELENRSAHIQKIQLLYENQKHVFEEKKQTINSLKISILEKEKNILTISEDSRLINEKLLFAIHTYHFTSIEQLESLLQQKDMLLPYSQRLEQYKHELKHTLEIHATLSTQLHNITWNPEDIIEIQKTITKSEEEIQQTRDAYIRVNEHIKSLKIKLEKWGEYHKRLSILRNDMENIQVCKSLFKQSGFVMYMSTKYMHMICDRANQRFTALTKHALQLEVSNNSFIVRDFLNNGKIRHVKTLSGGQAFQAALSLALALSESVQIHTPNISNFFFIDEGFGSQDKESLATVFDTLRSLQNEGKIVGLISHVDEIKENIPVYIHIENRNGMTSVQ